MDDRSTPDDQRSKTVLHGYLTEKKESRKVSVSADAQPSSCVLKRSYAPDMATCYYLLLTGARSLALLDCEFVSITELKSEFADLAANFESINDFALVIRPDDLKSSSATASINADSQVAAIFDGATVVVFDLSLKNGEIKKKFDVKLDDNEDILRKEFFLNFIIPDYFCIIKLWEDHQITEEEHSIDISFSTAIYSSLSAAKSKARMFETNNELENEQVTSIDQLKLFMLNSFDGNKPILNIFFTTPSTHSYDVISLTIEKDKKATTKAHTNEVKFDDDQVIK